MPVDFSQLSSVFLALPFQLHNPSYHRCFRTNNSGCHLFVLNVFVLFTSAVNAIQDEEEVSTFIYSERGCKNLI